MVFEDEQSYHTYLCSQAKLPRGFKVATTSFPFSPAEYPSNATMTMTLIALEQATASFAAMFTKNKFVGAPVIIGRERLAQSRVRAILINNKVSNVGVADGVADSECLCSELASRLECGRGEVLPSSTGVIGWRLPVLEMVSHLDELVAAREGESIYPAATGIMTTDLYPKIRRVNLADGAIVGIAKGAGMIEPNLATMLVFLLTDIAIERSRLREMLPLVVGESFNCLSIDSDQSSSDSVFLLSSGEVKGVSEGDFERGLGQVCRLLVQDIARNGEGVHHLLEITVRGAPSVDVARGMAKRVIRSPLVKTAICGNDPNVGRIMIAVGDYCSQVGLELNLAETVLSLGGVEVFKHGCFQLSVEKEKLLREYLQSAELYSSSPSARAGTFRPPLRYPPHQEKVEIAIELDLGMASATVWGGDLSHEYITENASYRS